MLSRVDFDFFGARRGELPQHDSILLLKRHVEGRSLNIPTSNHIADQLLLSLGSSTHRLREIVEDVAHLRLGMRHHDRQLVAFRKRQIDRQRKRVLNREVLLQPVPIGGP